MYSSSALREQQLIDEIRVDAQRQTGGGARDRDNFTANLPILSPPRPQINRQCVSLPDCCVTFLPPRVEEKYLAPVCLGKKTEFCSKSVSQPTKFYQELEKLIKKKKKSSSRSHQRETLSPSWLMGWREGSRGRRKGSWK